jgi:hypothetical protein
MSSPRADPSLPELESDLVFAKVQLAEALQEVEELRGQLRSVRNEFNTFKTAAQEAEASSGGSGWFGKLVGRRAGANASAAQEDRPLVIHAPTAQSDAVAVPSQSALSSARHARVLRASAFRSGRRLYLDKEDAASSAAARDDGRRVQSPWHPLRCPEILAEVWTMLGPDQWPSLRLVCKEWAGMMVRRDLVLWRCAVREGVLVGRWHSRLWMLVLLGSMGGSASLEDCEVGGLMSTVGRGPVSLGVAHRLRLPSRWEPGYGQETIIRPPLRLAKEWTRHDAPAADSLVALSYGTRPADAETPDGSAPHRFLRNTEAMALAMHSTLPKSLPIWYTYILRAVAASERAVPAVSEWRSTALALENVRREQSRVLERAIAEHGVSVKESRDTMRRRSELRRQFERVKSLGSNGDVTLTLDRLSLKEQDLYLKLRLLQAEADGPVNLAQKSLATAYRVVVETATKSLPEPTPGSTDIPAPEGLREWLSKEACLLLPFARCVAPLRVRAVTRLARRSQAPASPTLRPAAEHRHSRSEVHVGPTLPWEPPFSQIDADIARTFGTSGMVVKATDVKSPTCATMTVIEPAEVDSLPPLSEPPVIESGGAPSDSGGPSDGPSQRTESGVASPASGAASVESGGVSDDPLPLTAAGLPTPRERALQRMQRKLAEAGRVTTTPKPTVVVVVPPPVEERPPSPPPAEPREPLPEVPGSTAASIAPARLSLRRVLLVASCLDPTVGYTQGLNFVAWTALREMRDEAGAVALLLSLLQRPQYGLRYVYQSGLTRVRSFFFCLEALLHRFLPQLANHLAEQGVSPDMYASAWIMTLFSNGQVLPQDHVCMAWSLFVLDSWPGLLKVALAVMDTLRPTLLLCDFGEAVQLLNNIPPDLLPSPQTLIRRACAYPVSTRDLASLSQKFASTDTSAEDHHPHPRRSDLEPPSVGPLGAAREGVRVPPWEGGWLSVRRGVGRGGTTLDPLGGAMEWESDETPSDASASDAESESEETASPRPEPRGPTSPMPVDVDDSGAPATMEDFMETSIPDGGGMTPDDVALAVTAALHAEGATSDPSRVRVAVSTGSRPSKPKRGKQMSGVGPAEEATPRRSKAFGIGRIFQRSAEDGEEPAETEAKRGSAGGGIFSRFSRKTNP